MKNVQYEMFDLPEIAIIGKEGLCTKEKNAAQDLWRQANSDFREIADLGMKNADGSFVGFWGAMSDETLSFLPWTDDFSRGLYLAGVEVYEDTPVPDGWVKWVMPARKYLVTEVHPENYRELFEYVIKSLIPELGLRLAGAVCDFTEPATGQNKLFFRWSVNINTMKFKNYSSKDYEAVCDFLIELNRDNQNHINWNWGRFEWMMEHPEFDKSLMNSIGLWLDGDKVVGAAMYFGEAFVGALPAYSALYPEILAYAYRELKDENGLDIAVCDTCADEISMAQSAGFTLAEQTETIMRLDLDRELPSGLPDGLQFAQLDPVKEPYDFQWLLWQGFDHGTDKARFEQDGDYYPVIPEFRKHFDPALSIAAKAADGEYVSYCCLWYSDKTEYAYVEPVCTVPAYRGKGIAKAVIFEALNRAKNLGAKKAYVLSDMPFYEKLGFREDRHFTFLWKK